MSRQAIRAATHRALETRVRLLQSYPQWEEWRRQAQAVKAASLSRLDELPGRGQEQENHYFPLILAISPRGEKPGTRGGGSEIQPDDGILS